MASATMQLTSATAVTGWWLNQTVDIVDFGVRMGSRKKGWMTNEVQSAVPGGRSNESHEGGFCHKPLPHCSNLDSQLAKRFGPYTEYVIFTPGIAGAGPQRLIRTTGPDGAPAVYYTPDHYQTIYELEYIRAKSPNFGQDDHWGEPSRTARPHMPLDASAPSRRF